MHLYHELRGHAGARENITAQGTTYAARIASADTLQLRWEIDTNHRPAPLRGTVMLRRSGGAWRVDVGTFAVLWELAQQHGDERTVLEQAVRAAALEFAEGIEAFRLGLDRDAPIPFAVTGKAGER